MDWLVRAQDATPDAGFSRGYTLTRHGEWGGPGWQPSYPETTGYIIPTLYEAARFLNRPELARRATMAADWEIAVQLESGAVRGGVIGQPESPAVFNTGQVIFGWLAAFRETGEGRFADATRRAADFLVSMLDEDGIWRRGNSRFASPTSTNYNARTAWALAEAGSLLDVPEYMEAAARALRAVAHRVRDNGWIPDCCLTDAERPLLHTLAYTARGLLEGGRIFDDALLLRAAERTSRALAELVRADGSMPGRFAADWSPAARYSCLTGQAQMANNWLRLHIVTGAEEWIEPVPAVLRFLKSTQNRSTSDPGLGGGIKGSAPLTGDYGRCQVLNWATKFFVDALMRHTLLLEGHRSASLAPYVLA